MRGAVRPLGWLAVVSSLLACHEPLPERPRDTTPVTSSERPVIDQPAEPPTARKASERERASSPVPAPEAAPEPAWTRPSQPTDIRGDEVIPPGTPERNVAAFRKLPVQPGDGAPVGGIGASGIHLDELEVGHGWVKSRCSERSDEFTIGVQDRVNVCMRVVHERGTTTELGIEWLREGRQARRSKVAIGDTHALLTRAYLPISAGYEGEWQARIVAVDGTVIGEVSFSVVAR
jgi:hypothetical protein